MEFDGATVVPWCGLHLSDICSQDMFGGPSLMHVANIHIILPVAYKQDQPSPFPPSETDGIF